MEALIKRWRQHGIDVNGWYEELCKNPAQIKIESVVQFFEEYTRVDLSMYHIYHDMSKPYVRVIDDEGKEHYPDHSYHSHLMYIDTFGHDEYADMILHDMDFHRLRGDEMKAIWKRPDADHLYATAWAEIYANAQLFGGVESTSFKIKRKRLVKALAHRKK